MVELRQDQPFLVAEDLSAIGTMSLGAATPILAALGVPVAILPTQVLSTQTEGFGAPAKQLSNEWLTKTLAHWRAQHIQLAGGLIGYVGQIELLEQLTQAVSLMTLPLLVVDPVMGDGQALYPGLGESYVDVMRQLVPHADVLTPNWFEAQTLTGVHCDGEPTQHAVSEQLRALSTLLSSQGSVVITGIPMGHNVATAYFDGSQSDLVMTPQVAGHFYGTGDVFSALLSGALLQHFTFAEAVKLAVDGVKISLQQTASSSTQRRFGMQLSQLIRWLTKQVG